MANGEIGRGVAGGAMQGAALGTTIAPGVGTGIGAGIGAIYGALQGSAARRKRLAAEAADKAVNPIDPNLVAFNNRLGQLERSYRAGTDPASGFAKGAIGNAVAQTQANLVRTGRASVSDLLRAQGQGNIGYGQVGAAAAQRADNLIPLQGNIQAMLSERIYQRQQQRRADAYARASQAEQDVNNLFAGGLGTIPDMVAGFKNRSTNGLNFKPTIRATSTPMNPVGGPMLNQYQPGEAPWWTGNI